MDEWYEDDPPGPRARDGDVDGEAFDAEPAIHEVTAPCPWCFEPQQLDLDPSGGASQRYVEDCWVCCRPCVVQVTYGANGDVSVEVEREE